MDMSNAYIQAVTEHLPKAEIVFDVRSNIRKKGFEHPFFWAAFILVGEAQ